MHFRSVSLVILVFSATRTISNFRLRSPKLGQVKKRSLTPRVTRVPFRYVAILTAFLAYSSNSEILDQKCLLPLN